MKSVFLKIITFSVCMSMLAMTHAEALAIASAEEGKEAQYSDVSARGVWHRPNSSGRETTLEGLCSVLDEMASSGINMVFLETFYHGMTVFKTNLVPYYTGFEKYDYGEYPDYLTAFTSEAEKRGIEVHAWVECFYLGVKEDTALVKYFPSWLLINERGEIRHTTEGAELGGYIFFDPANQDAGAYLLSFYEEMLRSVPGLKGLNLDYIRYPVSDFNSGTDSGYTQPAMSEFAEKYSLTISESNTIQDFKAQIRSKSLVKEWIGYRADQVTSFVQQVSEMINEKYRDRIISVAVHPDINSAYNQKKQDFITWVDNGYIDVVTPMVYYYDSYQISSALKDMMARFNGVYCYSGLYTTYHNQSTAELEKHITASDDCGADGFILFESAKTFFDPSYDYADYLAKKYHKETTLSALPHWSTDKLIEASTGVITSILTDNGESEETVKGFIEQMETISLIGEESSEAIDKTIVEIGALRDHELLKKLGNDSYSSAKATLDMLLEHLEVRKARLSFKGFADDGESEEDEGAPEGNDKVEPPCDDENTDDGEYCDPPEDSDVTEKRSFFDIIRELFQRIANWFRNLFSKK